jgi:DNA-binding HxlR family transcriptional regulator
MSQHETPPFDVFSTMCPSREVLEHVMSRWGSLTLAALTAEPARFGELRRRVDGISEKMLSQTLKALEADGLVSRRVQSTLPPHVDYALTPSGEQVATAVKALIVSLYGVMPDVMRSRETASA